MKSIKNLLLGSIVVAGFGLFAGGKNVFADTAYTVKAGDTLSSISLNLLGSADGITTIAEANEIENINLIFVGEVLTIPSTDTTVNQNQPAKEIVQPEAAQEPAASAQSDSSTTSETTASTATVSGSEAAAKEWIANKESGGSYTAVNGQYYGRYQLTSSYLNGDYSAANQEKVADEYVLSRYGSWTAAQSFWLANGWY